MRKLLALVPFVLAAACSAGNAQNSGDHQAGGEQGRRDFTVGAFEKVALEGSHDVVVTVGGQPSVRAEGDAEAIERLDIRVENGSLRIGTRPESRSWFGHRGRVTIYVTAPALNGASIGGSGDMRIDRVQAQTFAASVAGSGDMEIGALRARVASFDIAGSGDIRASGEAEQASLAIAGSGDLALDGLQTRRASISVAGSGDVAVQASESVEGSLIGSGDVTVRGSARCNLSKSGSGDIHCGG
ncbi:MAG TPA: head GIN domain-containing protein [Allosphingosinicella sp.]|nr:head GIN domain-containing protein [Allosphingosinicella sp.]